jgi:hypothetical protein
MWHVRLVLQRIPFAFSLLIKSGLVLLGLAVFQDGPAENCILVFLGHKVSSACSCVLYINCGIVVQSMA